MNVSLNIDSSTLSALFFKHWPLNGSQFGFLLGMKINQTEDKISDSQGHLCNTNTLIYISSFIPCAGTDSLYHRNGLICTDTMDALLKQTNQTLLGWYSFRHNSKFKPSLKEFNLHRNLAMVEKYVTCPHDFLFFLCTTSCTENMSTHICNHGFMQLIDRNFLEVPMSLVNLGDTTRTEYHRLGNATVTDNQTVKQILTKLRGNHLTSSGEMEQIKKIHTLSASLNKGINHASSKLLESEAELEKLTDEVSRLRKLVTQIELEDFHFALAEKENEAISSNRERNAKEDEQLDLLMNNLSARSNHENILTSSELLVAIDDQKSLNFES